MRALRLFLRWGMGGLAPIIIILGVSACDSTGVRSTVRMPTDTPIGPATFVATDFSIVYPGEWLAVPGQPPTGQQGTRVSILIPDQANGHEVLQILETSGGNQSMQSICAARQGSPTSLAGLPTYYATAVGNTVRQWTYVDSNRNTYSLVAFDLGQDSTPQDRQRDDQILATFKVKNTTPGC
jgi:hypothetical protein